jgi:hypothetical protein
MVSSTGALRLRHCRSSEIGIAEHGEGRNWPAGAVFLATVASPHTAHYLLAIPEAVLEGAALTAFLDRVAPFGCPPPPSLIRAYSLPDAPYPSILLKEHDDAPAGLGDAYRRFAAHARPHWLAALQETGPGLVPALAWQTGRERRFVAPDEWAGALGSAGVGWPGPADDYLGRGLLLLADPHLADAWEARMSLGGVTKVRKITGREFPVWVDLPAHQPALLASPLLTRVERLLAAA